MKLDLIGKVDSWRINKNIIRNTACLKKGYLYGNLLLKLIDMLETYALIMINLFAVMNLVAA